MTLQELKTDILNNSLTDDFFILVCKENYFIADQYIEKICANRHCVVNNIHDLASTCESALSLVFDFSTDLNVLKTDTFSELAEDYDNFKNCIVICKEVDKKIIEQVKDYIVEIPNLLDWQVKDYIKTKCPGLDQQPIDWLYKNTKGDIYRIDNELDKLALFSPEQQQEVLSEIKFDKLSDLYSIGIFDLSNAIISNNKLAILGYLQHKYACDFTSIQITNLLLSNFKKTLLIIYGGGLSPEEIGVSSAQYNYIFRQQRGLSESFLIQAISFLSEIDFKLKSGQLDMPEELRIDYILNKVLGLFKN